MAEMHHQIQIDASPEKVYEAISTRKGLQGWWTGDSVAEPHVGSVAEFGFYDRQVLFRMRIDELQPGKRVVWTCIGDYDEWKDTRLTWEISQKEGASILNFVHGNWRSTTSFFASCNSTWGMLMYRLKDYVEGNNPGPYWEK
jgi:uncharacterized protein YndB with AHSA1/START domain